MKEIQLTKGQVALVDDEDFELINSNKWCIGGKYAVRRVGPRPGVVVYMHKEVMNLDITLDHVDNNTLNNRKCNLRVANKAQNSMNRPLQSNSTTGYKGVARMRDKFQAHIKYNGKKIHLGTFDVVEDAALTYDRMALQLFGTFAQVNFPR